MWKLHSSSTIFHEYSKNPFKHLMMVRSAVIRKIHLKLSSSLFILWYRLAHSKDHHGYSVTMGLTCYCFLKFFECFLKYSGCFLKYFGCFIKTFERFLRTEAFLKLYKKSPNLWTWLTFYLIYKFWQNYVWKSIKFWFRRSSFQVSLNSLRLVFLLPGISYVDWKIGYFYYVIFIIRLFKIWNIWLKFGSLFHSL